MANATINFTLDASPLLAFLKTTSIKLDSTSDIRAETDKESSGVCCVRLYPSDRLLRLAANAPESRPFGCGQIMGGEAYQANAFSDARPVNGRGQL